MNTCIYTKKSFEKAAGEHILQNFLGARWTSDSIVSDEVQTTFGKTIDAAFEKGLRPVRNLLGTKGGRGEKAPTLKRLSAASGETIDLETGGKPRLARPIVKAKKLASGEGYEVSIQLGHKDQAGWALAELRKLIPGLEMTEEDVLRLGTAESGYIEGQVPIRIVLGGTDYIRGALKACFNLLAVNNIFVLDSCFDPVRNFVLNGSGTSSDFLRWPKQDDKSDFPRLGPIDQFVGIANRGSKVEGIIRLFGGMSHAVRLTASYSGPAFQVGYLVNPLRDPLPAENRAPDFSAQVIPDFDQQSKQQGPESRAAMQDAIYRVAEVHQERSRSEMVKDIVEEVHPPNDGKPFTKEQFDEIIQKINQRLLRIDEAPTEKPTVSETVSENTEK
jgi:hypothetical protein